MAPVQIVPLVFLRIAFGAVMLWEIWRYFDQGWIKALFHYCPVNDSLTGSNRLF